MSMETGRAIATTVLIVDDDETIRSVVRSFLELRHRLRILEAADGIEAVEALLKSKVDLLIVDLHMPRMSGLEVVGFVRRTAATRGIRVVMLTTERDVRSRRKAMALGVDVYVNKPFDPVDFVHIVDRLVAPSEADEEPDIP